LVGELVAAFAHTDPPAHEHVACAFNDRETVELTAHSGTVCGILSISVIRIKADGVFHSTFYLFNPTGIKSDIPCDRLRK